MSASESNDQRHGASDQRQGANDQPHGGDSPDAPLWLDSVFVHTLPFSQRLINALIDARITTARQLLGEPDRLHYLAAPSRVAEVLLFVRTLASLGEDTIRSMSARTWDDEILVPLAPPFVLTGIADAPSHIAEIRALVADFPARNQILVLSRLGLVGYPLPTLDVLADHAGITRERVRQITIRFADRVSKWHVRLPRCAKLVEEIRRNGGVRHVTEVPPARRRVLHAVAQLSALGAKPELHWEDGLQAWLTDDGKAAVRSYREAIVDRLPEIRKRRSHWGAIPVELLTCEVDVPPGVAAQTVLRPPADWVIQDDCIVIPNTHSTLTRLARKVIEAIGPVPVTVLQEGLEGLDKFSPPKLSITKFILSNHRDFRVRRGDVVEFVGDGDAGSSLTPAQRAAVVVIRRADGIVDNDGYLMEMEAAGIGTSLASATLRQPFIVRLERGVYGLLGQEFEPWRVRQARTAREDRFLRSLVDSQRTAQHIHLDYRLTRPCVVSGELPLPSSMAIPPDEWIGKFRDGTTCVLWTMKAGKIRGLRPWMRQANLSIGDRVTVTVHEEERVIHIQDPA